MLRTERSVTGEAEVISERWRRAVIGRVQVAGECCLSNVICRQPRFTREYVAIASNHCESVEVRRGGTFGVEMIRVDHQDVQSTDPAVSHIAIRALVANTSPFFEFDFGNGRRRHDVSAVHSGWVNVQPANQDCVFHKPGRNRILALCLPWILVTTKLDEVGYKVDPFEPLYADLAPDNAGAELLAKLWCLTQVNAPADLLSLDATVVSLLAQLCNRGQRQSSYALPPELADKRLRRLVDYIEEHLNVPLTLDDLATVAGMSVGHLPRAFRTATGCSPHAYVLNRRIQLAQHLLIHSDLSVTEIAFETGFSSGPHFATTFKRNVGLAPSLFKSQFV